MTLWASSERIRIMRVTSIVLHVAILFDSLSYVAVTVSIVSFGV